ncbi:DUF1801 domain-containing protein [Pontibacter anaerobius]|uniref:DUF1801 domain-containing protein n=1 Tax=Pontibacter anaerobius TaxID=2993940 RepID=A0ABT3RBI2_9BACT|nr:DUF1801 domain-containing protein [Pontibacter anaerobius]
MNQQVTDYIEKAGEQKEIMQAIRQLIHETVPHATEEFKWGRPVFRSQKDFAYLKSAKAYVSLGFFDYHKLSDTHNLLQGTGKDMRHVKLKSMADLNSQLLQEWFKAATV